MLPTEILLRYNDSWVESLPSVARFILDVSVVSKGMPNNGQPTSKSNPGTLADKIRSKHSKWQEDNR
jgi:hypothetical protein